MVKFSLLFVNELPKIATPFLPGMTGEGKPRVQCHLDFFNVLIYLAYQEEWKLGNEMYIGVQCDLLSTIPYV